jgi:hypothetical protein
MNKNKELLKQPLFQLAVGVPLGIGILLMLIIFSHDNLSLAIWNSVNIETAYTYFKIPLFIMSLAFPFGALVIANHRSELTLAMMKLQGEQNKFANYFVHLDRFKSELNEKKFGEMFKSLRTAHDALYPDLMTHGLLEPDHELLAHLQEELQQVNHLANKLSDMIPDFLHPKDIPLIKSNDVNEYSTKANLIESVLHSDKFKSEVNKLYRIINHLVGRIFIELKEEKRPCQLDYNKESIRLKKYIIALSNLYEFDVSLYIKLDISGLNNYQEKYKLAVESTSPVDIN